MVSRNNPESPAPRDPFTLLEGTASCPAGKRVIGGGFQFLGGMTYQMQVVESFPRDATTWKVALRNPTPWTAYDVQMRVFAVCAIAQ